MICIVHLWIHELEEYDIAYGEQQTHDHTRYCAFLVNGLREDPHDDCREE